MRSRTLLSLGALAVLNACAADIPTPTSPASLVRAKGRVSNVSSNARGIPNSQKYSNKGAKPARGRSGSASIEARALLGKDGHTLVEVSTGSLEDGTHSGTIAKVQLKAGATQNFNNLANSGYWSTDAIGWVPGRAVQVQANVRGIDPKRTDVVTVSTGVVRRPDIKVSSVNVNGAVLNVPSTIVAAVQELNGDVGARADCVLSIDGNDVDHADGIWVDAGSAVSCMFSHTFSSSGTFTVAVRAANVSPGDWDTGNNGASTTVTLGGSSSNVAVRSVNATYEYDRSITRYWSDDYPPYTYDQNNDSFWDRSYVSASGSEQGPWLSSPFQTASYEIWIDGASVVNKAPGLSWVDEYDDGESFRYKCSNFQDGEVFLSGCAYDYYGATTDYSYSGFVSSGYATYFGQQTYCYSWGCNTYVSNNTSTWTSDLPVLAEGSIVRARLRFVDGNNAERRIDETTAPLVRLDFDPLSPYLYCYSYGGGNHCNYSRAEGYLIQGSVYLP